MRLLLDQNLSYRLKETLRDIFSEILHVSDAGLESADDLMVWEYAKARSLILVSKDSDFRQLSFALGHPPKIVWIRRGNCTTSEIATILRKSYEDLVTFDQDEEGSFLALS